tara:strand:- start:6858 stop:7052 length:195 start_codon:yes stop_codon:yes gene_type:complete
MIGGKRKGRSRRGGRKSRGGSMAGRLAVPAGLLILQKMMHSRKHKKHSSNKHRTMRRRKGSRRR